LLAKLKDADLAVVCDFGHGFIDAETIELLEREARFLAVNVQSNAGNIGYNMLDKYARADFMCIDAMEARLAVRDKHADLAEVVGTHLPALVDCDNFIVTHGRSGCFAKTRDGIVNIPAFSASIVDTVGAGDAFFAVAAPCLAVGGTCEMAAFVGNVAGALKIGIIGHRRYLTRLDIQRSVAALLK
jgi:sugar/nucleoside kinase (ribokinase family)